MIGDNNLAFQSQTQKIVKTLEDTVNTVSTEMKPAEDLRAHLWLCLGAHYSEFDYWKALRSVCWNKTKETWTNIQIRDCWAEYRVFRLLRFRYHEGIVGSL